MDKLHKYKPSDFTKVRTYSVNDRKTKVTQEDFIKAINVARNISVSRVEGFTTVNMDMFQHYRPTVNVIQRPTQNGSGKGYALTGHHEIMVPLLFQTVLALLDSGEV